jgi:hypothetical protein
MDLETFNDKILRLLKRWSHLGGKTDDYGTRYIGHYDKGTPFAYLHQLHKAGTAESILLAEQAIGIEFPKQYREFLNLFNGAGFFSPAGFDVFGILQKEYFPEYTTQPWRFASDIVSNNNQPWQKVLPDDALVLGRNDGVSSDIICLTNDGSIVEIDPLEPDDFSTCWPSFDDWLISEVETTFMEHDDNGEILEITGMVQ